LARFDVQPFEQIGGSLPGNFQFGIIVALAHPKDGNRRFLLRKGYEVELSRRRLPDGPGALTDDNFPCGRHDAEYGRIGKGRKSEIGQPYSN
jgi:hypothetical protein